MPDLEAFWRQNTDDALTDAARHLQNYSEETQRAIQAELRRRGLPERQPGECPRCGRHLSADYSYCPSCGLSLSAQGESRVPSDMENAAQQTAQPDRENEVSVGSFKDPAALTK